jgi:hypothetical protein
VRTPSSQFSSPFRYLSILGDALYSLKKYTDCYNAYNSASRISPSDSNIKQKCELAQKAIRDSVDEAQNSSRHTSTSTPKNLLGTVQPYLRIFLLLLALVYFIPFTSLSYSAYRGFNYLAILNYGLSVYFAHGTPQFNMNYAQRLLLDPTTMSVPPPSLPFSSLL